jgi:streptogramin lyase
MTGSESTMEPSHTSLQRRFVRKVMGWCSLVLLLGTVATVITVAPVVHTPAASADPVGTVKNFPSGVGNPQGIAAGPDDAVWFTTGGTNSIGRITSDGTITDFTDPSINGPSGITLGPDGALWFTNLAGNSIGRITTDGTVTNFTDPSIKSPGPITKGSDGNLWFLNRGNDSIARITPDGTVSNFTDPSLLGPSDLILGSDGALWFTQRGGVGRIGMDGTISTFSNPSIAQGTSITSGPDGALWFTYIANVNVGFNIEISEIGRITTGGVFTLDEGNFNTIDESVITTGSDGNLWFTEDNLTSNGGLDAAIGSLTPSGVFSGGFADPTLESATRIIEGPDGAFWYINAGNSTIGRATMDGTVTNFSGDISQPSSITKGPDGALWFTNDLDGSNASGSIGRIATDGTLSEFSDPSIDRPQSITEGPDGALWFTNGNGSIGSIGRITTGGVVTNFTSTSIKGAVAIAAGPDDALWFTNEVNNTIGRITTDGVVSSFANPTISSPGAITEGPDEALWFTNGGNNSIGRISPDGTVTNFTDPTINEPSGIAAGPDGALWFTNDGNNTIGRITAGGIVTNFSDPSISGPVAITSGPDNALWFTNEEDGSIGRITTDGTVTNFEDPSIFGPTSITSGPDDAVWFTNIGHYSIGRIQAGPPALTSQMITITSTPPAPPTVGGTYVVTATGGGSGNPVLFSIDTSSSTGACSVAGSTVSFTGVGSCVIDADQAGNATFAVATEVSQSLTIQQAPPTCPSAASACQSQANSDPNGTAQVNTGGPGGTTATGSGFGALTIGHYATDPVAAPAIGATGEYFDVATSADSAFSSVSIEDCNLLGGNVVQWWNPAANSGAGAWQAVSNQTFVAGSPSCVNITVDSSTSPNLSQLVGTIFAVVKSTSKPTVTSAATTTFTVGVSNGFTVTTTGFPAPALTLTGTLPAGLTFLDNGNGTATISGTTTAAAKTYSLKITAKNTAGSVVQTFSLVVNQAPTVTSAATATFAVGKSSTFKVTSKGTPTAALGVAGSLPSGLTFVDNGNGTGSLSGTPAAGTSGSYPITINAINAAGTGSQPFTLVVNQTPAFSGPATTTFTVGLSGTFTVATTGSPTAALTFTGTLPAGLTFVDNGNGTATISGTTTAAAKTYSLRITAKNSAGSVVETFSLVVNQAPTVTSAASAAFTIGKSTTFKVTSTGSPAAALTLGGTLPAGVTFVDNGGGKGTLSGTPVAGTSGSYPVTITAVNAAGSATQPFTLVVNQVPAFTSATTTTFTIGSPSNFAVTTTGSPTAALTFTGTMPAGLTFVDNGNGTAKLSGTTTAAAKTYTLKITAKNSAGSAVQSFSLVVKK